MVAAAVVIAAGIGIPGSALAFGSAGSGSKPTTAPSIAPGTTKPVLSDLSRLASAAGITLSQLQSGLAAAKPAGGNSPSGVAAFAGAAGVPTATAQRVVASVFGAQPSPNLTSPSVVAILATQLGVSTAAAQGALEQLGALSRAQGIDPSSAAFAAIAHNLGVSPAQLAAALPLVKQAERPAQG
jgi:hypothetical protein